MTKHNFFIKSALFHTNSKKNIDVAIFLPQILDQDINYQKRKTQMG